MIHKIDDDSFDFSNVSLNKPVLFNGSYHIKFSHSDKPLYVQFPKSKLKNGIQKSGKKHHCDLLFSNQNEKLFDWIETLENHCKTQLFAKRAWFETDFTEEDIDSFFISTLKSYKLGKFFTMRVHVPDNLGIFDDSGEQKTGPLTEMVNTETNIVSIAEIMSIKCTDKSFQIEIEIKQMLLVKELFDTCMIQVDSVKKEPKPTSSNLPVVAPSLEMLSTPVVAPSLEMLPTPVVAPSLEMLPTPVEFTESALVSSPTDETVSVSREATLVEPTIDEGNIIETIHLENFDLDETPSMKIKPRNDIYQKIYKEAKEKARVAKKLALVAYLEAKRIKNEYMIDDMDDNSDNEEELFLSG
jgi:hypothetical protein